MTLDTCSLLDGTSCTVTLCIKRVTSSVPGTVDNCSANSVVSLILFYGRKIMPTYANPLSLIIDRLGDHKLAMSVWSVVARNENQQLSRDGQQLMGCSMTEHFFGDRLFAL